MFIENHDKMAMRKAMEILTDEQKKEFMDIFNREYKRIWVIAIEEDARRRE